jgi:predicted nucleic acid-binding protein
LTASKIVDTSAWVPFFNQPRSREKREIDALIDADGLALVGVVLAELIQGCRTPTEADTVIFRLSGLRFLDTTFATWRQAGELSFTRRRKGLTLPLSDRVIAALALEHRCGVYALDPHFEQVPGLTLHRPGAPGSAGRE